MQKFYENKRLFITGGSGFLGRVFIEKVLRATDVECIYMLIRPKRSQTAEERIKQLFDDAIFQKLRELKPNAQERVIPIFGDCTLPNLGISPADRAMLIANVNIIIHSAATVRFDEPLYNAIMINVHATNELLELSRKMLQLQAFVHVSSAFANCPEPYVKEKFYTNLLGIRAGSALKLAELLGPNMTNALTLHLLDKFPNTYTFTKALAEDLILTRGAGLPICIFRPCIIVPTYKEPITGWTNNFVGPLGIFFPIMYGFVRSVYVDSKLIGQMVPVDFCANCMLACAWETATTARTAAIKTTEPTEIKIVIKEENETARIYNFVPDTRNIIPWGQFLDDFNTKVFEYPFTKMLWYPFFFTTNSMFLHNLLSFALHIIPYHMIDFYRVLCGKKARLMKTYRKYSKGIDIVNYFKARDWKFDAHNTDKLWSSLLPEEKLNFNFDMLSLSWIELNRSMCAGMRRYLAKEEPETLPKARERLQRLHKIHRTTIGLADSVVLLLLTWLLLHLTL